MNKINPDWEKASHGIDFGNQSEIKIGQEPANNSPEQRGERPTPAENGVKPYWWMPHDADPLYSGWYYVQEETPQRKIGIRYFDDSDQSWWAVSKDGKNDGSLVPNETFRGWLVIPDISDYQRA